MITYYNRTESDQPLDCGSTAFHGLETNKSPWIFLWYTSVLPCSYQNSNSANTVAAFLYFLSYSLIILPSVAVVSCDQKARHIKLAACKLLVDHQKYSNGHTHNTHNVHPYGTPKH